MGATMRKRFRLLLLAALMALLAYFAVVSLAEYAKTGHCYQNGSILSEEDLHDRTIRNLLTAEMKSSAQANKYKTYVKTFLIQRSLTPGDVIDAVASKSIINLPKSAAYQLNTDLDVANVDPEFLRGDFSIIHYSQTFGHVGVVPSRGVKAADADIARKHLDGKRKRGFDLSLFERALGYGNHYFRVDVFSHIDLACCEELSGKYPKDGKPPESYSWQIIDSIKKGEMPVRRYLVVSNCGDLLHRSEDGYVWFLF